MWGQVVEYAEYAAVGVLSHQVVSWLHQFEQRDLGGEDVRGLLLKIVLQGLSDQRDGFASFFRDCWPQIEELLG